MHSTAFDRAPAAPAAINYFTYLARALRRGLTAERPDLVLCMTDPPMVGDVALVVARRFRVPLVVVSQDVFPEIAVELSRLRNPLLVGLLGVLIRFYLRRADTRRGDRGDDAATTRAKGVRPSAPARDSELGRHDGGRAAAARQPLGAVERPRRPLRRHALGQHRPRAGSRDADSGCGAPRRSRAAVGRPDRLRRAARPLCPVGGDLRADRVSFLDYQPRELLSQSLSSSADIHYRRPCARTRRICRARAASTPYSPRATGLAARRRRQRNRDARARGRLRARYPAWAPDLIADDDPGPHRGRPRPDEMGQRGRAWVEEDADREIALARYRAVR